MGNISQKFGEGTWKRPIFVQNRRRLDVYGGFLDSIHSSSEMKEMEGVDRDDKIKQRAVCYRV